MSIESNYEINVTKNGKHYCKIELGWCLPENAKRKFAELKAVFGAGYELTMEYWECVGHPVEDKEV